MQETNNKMGTQPVASLILTMSLPAMFSMLIQSLYNIVDSIFVARYSADAFAAVSLAFPIQTLMIAVGVGTGVGAGVGAGLCKVWGARQYNLPGADPQRRHFGRNRRVSARAGAGRVSGDVGKHAAYGAGPAGGYRKYGAVFGQRHVALYDRPNTVGGRGGQYQGPYIICIITKEE